MIPAIRIASDPKFEKLIVGQSSCFLDERASLGSG
jgi:hypothetical protein